MPTTAPRLSEARVGGRARGPHEDVPGIDAQGRGGQAESVGQLDGEVLQGVDREVDPAVQQGSVQLLCEDPLASDLRQGRVQTLVARRADDLEHDLDPSALLEPGLGRPALAEGQPRAPRSDPEERHGSGGERGCGPRGARPGAGERRGPIYQLD